jgi:hypothetical protein
MTPAHHFSSTCAALYKEREGCRCRFTRRRQELICSQTTRRLRRPLYQSVLSLRIERENGKPAPHAVPPAIIVFPSPRPPVGQVRRRDALRRVSRWPQSVRIRSPWCLTSGSSCNRKIVAMGMGAEGDALLAIPASPRRSPPRPARTV